MDKNLISEIEKNGQFIGDYSVYEYNKIEDAGYVEIYLYKGIEYKIVTWKPEAERGYIGKEILKL